MEGEGGRGKHRSESNRMTFKHSQVGSWSEVLLT